MLRPVGSRGYTLYRRWEDRPTDSDAPTPNASLSGTETQPDRRRRCTTRRTRGGTARRRCFAFGFRWTGARAGCTSMCMTWTSQGPNEGEQRFDHDDRLSCTAYLIVCCACYARFRYRFRTGTRAGWHVFIPCTYRAAMRFAINSKTGNRGLTRSKEGQKRQAHMITSDAC